MESNHFLAISSPWQKLQMLFFHFWFTPPNAKNLLPKIACDNTTLPRQHPWSRTRQLSSCLEKVGNPLNFGADPCCHGNEIWPRRGDLDAYRLVCLSVNTITPEPLEILSRNFRTSYGQKGKQVWKWLYRGVRVVMKCFWCSDETALQRYRQIAIADASVVTVVVYSEWCVFM